MDASAMRRRLSEARVAHLATADAQGLPHIVPIVFAHHDEDLYFVVDEKPKRTRNLKRLRNIAGNPRVSVLVDHYEDDWTRLWWVRVDGVANVIAHETDARRAIDLLVAKYPQYAEERPQGPVVAISVETMTGWEASDNPAC
jgi:PPOX class probable F420-dependent enzyme